MTKNVPKAHSFDCCIFGHDFNGHFECLALRHFPNGFYLQVTIAHVSRSYSFKLKQEMSVEEFTFLPFCYRSFAKKYGKF